MPHANLSRADLHEAKRIKASVRAASTVNVSLSTPGSAIDGVTLSSGDSILLKDQTTTSQNGIYLWTGASLALSRRTDASAATDFLAGDQVYVREGSTNGSTYWKMTQSAAITVGTTALTYVRLDSSGLSDPTTTRGDIIVRGASAIARLAVGTIGRFLGSDGTDPVWTNSATHYATTGLTGAVAAARFVGGTTSGAPSAGTFAVGDFIVDQTGKFFICTNAGTPGTWQQSSGGMSNPMTTNQDIIVGASSGTPARLGVGANGQVLTINAGAVSWQNSASGFTNPMTSIGDLISGTTAGAAQRVAVGANGQILTVVGGQPGWANNTGGTSLGANSIATANVFLATHFS